MSKRGRGGLTVEDGEAADDLETGFRSSISGGGGPTVELVAIAVPDRPLCLVGLQLLERACKSARKSMEALGLDTAQLGQRETEGSALSERLKDEALSGLGVPLRWIPTLRVGLSLEYAKAQAMVDQQVELVLDTDETHQRIRQLDRLMSDLDVARLGGEADE